MREIDLRNIWNSDRDDARSHYESISDVEKLARRQSKGVLDKIRRNIFIEFVFSIILVIILAIVIYRWDSKVAFWIFAVPFAGIIYFSVYLNVRFFRDLRSVYHKQVVDALKRYVYLVGRYIRRVKIMTWYLTPVGYLIGLTAGTFAGRNQESLMELLVQMGIGAIVGLPLLLGLMWFATSKYIKWIYGKHYDSLKKILNNLEEEETSV